MYAMIKQHYIITQYTSTDEYIATKNYVHNNKKKRSFV